MSLTVIPCWCYGSETMDMDPLRPGAVYLEGTLASHNQKGFPAFGIYGRDVQETTDTTIPGDVVEKILRFVRSGLSVAAMRGKAYRLMGGCSMGYG